ncbi:MAG TPA: hypothetical protein VJI13_00195 [Candidatus Norongarragalinales archaeon]|nr:hypothetical protein [Candidatus Norongarragalinales archaeon]
MRQVAVLIAVLFVALAFNSIFPRQSPTGLDRATVEKFIVEDAKVSYGEYGKYQVVKFEQTGDKWKVELDISMTYNTAPGTPQTCMKVFRRYYSLFPIVFREELYESTC